ncbi:MAG: hypothetical protein OHK0046_44840 [Anaerolineae bacterium]
MLRKFVMLCLLIGSVFVFPAQAATVSVTCDDDLNAAVTAANTNGEDDTLNLDSGCTYTLANTLVILADNFHTLTINGNGATITANNAFRVVSVDVDADLTLNNVTLTGGLASGVDNLGGGLKNNGGRVQILNSTITANTAQEGGGVYNNESLNVPGVIEIENSVISANIANGSGGGLHNDNGTADLRNTITITGSTISDNSATNGGGLYIDNGTNSGGTVTITRSTIRGNSASSDGGGLVDMGGGSTLTIESSTVGQNDAGNVGGGLAVFNTGTITITNSTLAFNTADVLAGGIRAGMGQSRIINIGNSIIARNTAPTSPDIDGTVTSQDYNFVGDPSGTNILGTTTHNLVGNPQFETTTLQDNGGPTFTVRLAASSPAVDKGNCTAVQDQRGFPRPVDFANIPGPGNGCDIGAVERENTPPVAEPDTFDVSSSSGSVIGAPGVLSNDDDVDSDSLTAVLVSNPTSGTIQLNADGGFTYTPAANSPLTVTFTYKANDGRADSNVVTVTLNLNNTTPSARSDSYTMEPNSTLTIAAPGVLTNDTDTDGDTLTAVLVTDVTHGTLNLNSSGAFTYTPNANHTGTDVFTYRASDGRGTSGVAAVNITIEEDIPLDPDPSNLQVSNTTVAPVYPTLGWTHQTLADQTEVPGDWYNVVIASVAGGTLLDVWVPVQQVCAGLQCSYTPSRVELPLGLASGEYTFRVRAWDNGVLSQFSELVFAVSLTPPALPSGFTVTTNLGRPVLVFPPDNAAWYQVYIGGLDNTYSHINWYPKPESCVPGAPCELVPNAHPTNGRYEVYVQSWNLSGLSVGGFLGWAGPRDFTLDLPIPGTVTPLTVTDADSGRPTFQWESTEGATWYQVWIGATDFSTTAYLQWLPALDMRCGAGGVCTVTPDVILANNTSYAWYVQAWGPGGLGQGGLDGWIAGDNFTVSASLLNAPTPITPTGTVNTAQPVFEWAHLPSASWYYLEVDTVPAGTAPLYAQWLPVEQVGCREANVCALRVPGLYLADGSYRWVVQAYNPAGLSLRSNSLNFTIGR